MRFGGIVRYPVEEFRAWEARQHHLSDPMECLLSFDGLTSDFVPAANMRLAHNDAVNDLIDRSGCFALHNPVTGLTLLGWSKDMRRKWLELEPLVGAQLVPLMFWKTDDPTLADRKLMEKFSDHRITGKWVRTASVSEWLDELRKSGGVPAENLKVGAWYRKLEETSGAYFPAN